VTNVSPKDFQTLRDNHTMIDWQSGADYPKCVQCNAPYPCDAIAVLDAWEVSLICDHITIENGVERQWWFYCPKCDKTL